MILVDMNDRCVEMEIDTDTAVSLISRTILTDTSKGSINQYWATWHKNLSPTQ